MGIFDTIRRMLGGSSQPEQRESAASGITGSAPRLGLSYDLDTGGKEQPINVAVAFRCIQLLSDSVAMLPLMYMRQKGGVFVEDTASPLHYLLRVQPSPAYSAVDFWRTIMRDMITKGNAYVLPLYTPGSFDMYELKRIKPEKVSHDTDNDVYNVQELGQFAEEEMLHFKNFTLDGKKGVSTLTYARYCLEVAREADYGTLDRYKAGGVKGIVSDGGTVQGYGEYQDRELDRMAYDIESEFRNGRRIVPTYGDTRFTQLGMSSADMQWLETRKFTDIQICRFFGCDPYLVFADTSNNYKSVEMANVGFLSHALNPYLRTIENELHRKLVSPSLCCKRKFEFDRRGIYACDLASRIDYQTKTIAAGIYTVNEWRAAENKLPVEGGDKPLVSANLKAITELSAEATPPMGDETDNQPTPTPTENGD